MMPQPTPEELERLKAQQTAKFAPPPPLPITRGFEEGPSIPAPQLPPATISVKPVPSAEPANPALDAAKAEYSRLTSGPQSKPGVDQIQNPFLRHLGQAGNIALNVLAPGISTFVPGTSMHHELVVHDAARNLNQQNSIANDEQRRQSDQTAQRLQESEIPKNAAMTAKALADANAPVSDEWIEAKNPEVDPDNKEVGAQTVFYSKNDPNKKKFGGAPVAAHPTNEKPERLPESERPLPNVPQINQAFTARYQVRHNGQPLPEHSTLPPNATVGDYNRINQLLSAEESAEAAKDARDAANAARAQSFGERSDRAEERQDAARQRQEGQIFRQALEMQKPHQAALKTESAKLQNLEQAQSLLSSGNGESAALAIPKILSAIVGGNGSGLRMTQSELNSIAQARGVSGSLEAWLNKLREGKNLSSEQVKQLQGIVSDAKQRAQMRADVANHAIDRMGTAENTAQLRYHDAYARAYNSALDKGLPVAWDAASLAKIKPGQRFFNSDTGEEMVK